ncbi:MAG: PEP/pyruvate-binding domain-containing protein [Acidimicrobiia bacterium]|nr:PEP/pyruvate-binding domain-containing protein [Acidimicrobiia bacterium]
MPTTWVVRPGIDDSQLLEAADLLDPAGQYAVRSSANVEDGTVASYAGQFGSELDVPAGKVLAAVRRVRQSAGSERVAAYRDRLNVANSIDVTVMVQPMVTPVVSGVAFSRNPITGLNEVVVEAVAGRGDRLVGEGVTPERWINHWGSWLERADTELLPEDVLNRLAADTRRIATDYGSPVDLEWVWDGAELWWVQLRPITGLDEIAIYSNRISREVMPGIIKPLVWSVNVPMVNRAWVDLFTEAIGPNDIRPEDLARAFAYRSYFNMGAIGDIFELLGMPRDSLELLLGLPAGSEQPSFKPTGKTMRLLPRMLRVAAGKAGYGKEVPRELGSLRQAYSKFYSADLSARSDSALLSDIAALSQLGVRSAYANIVTPLLANLYNTLLRKQLVKAGLDPEIVDIGGSEELADVNPNMHLEELRNATSQLTSPELAAARRDGPAALPEPVRSRFEEFIDRFGHLSASGNDFSVAPWRETPEAVLAMALDHSALHGDTVRLDWSEAEARLGALARPLVRALRRRTQQFVAHRENVSFTYTYGYGLFRRYFLEIGRRLVERGLLAETADVMFLYFEEVRAALLGLSAEELPAELVDARKAEIEAVRDVAMPDVIYGDDFVPAPVDIASGALSGIPTSRGHHRGTVRVVAATSDFAKVEAGDVIAIPYSDVGWTPLFARAGAVVAAAGGMLSHSSIVAREYRIPCVVSVAGAMQLPDGATVTVDGYSGSVVVDEAR